MPPFPVGSVPFTPAVSETPVQFVRFPAVGVPSPGVIRFALVIVGEVENTKFVLVVPVAPAAV